MKVALKVGIMLFIFAPLRANAYDVVKMEMKDKVLKSDLIFSGLGLSISELTLQKVSVKCANFRVDILIKGSGEILTVRFALSNGMSELDPKCCLINERHLIFAKKRRNSIFILSNGPSCTPMPLT